MTWAIHVLIVLILCCGKVSYERCAALLLVIYDSLTCLLFVSLVPLVMCVFVKYEMYICIMIDIFESPFHVSRWLSCPFFVFVKDDECYPPIVWYYSSTIVHVNWTFKMCLNFVNIHFKYLSTRTLKVLWNYVSVLQLCPSLSWALFTYWPPAILHVYIPSMNVVRILNVCSSVCLNLSQEQSVP